MKYTSNSTIVKAALDHGCKTAKDLAKFLKEFNPEVGLNHKGEEIVYLSLFR